MSVLKEARAEVGALLGEVLSQWSEEQPSESAEANAGVYMALRAFTEVFAEHLRRQLFPEELADVLAQTDAFLEETEQVAADDTLQASA